MARSKIDVKGTFTCWRIKVRPLPHLSCYFSMGLFCVLKLKDSDLVQIIRHLMMSQERRAFSRTTDTAGTTAASVCSIMCSQRWTFIYIPQRLSSQKKNISSQLLLLFFHASVPPKKAAELFSCHPFPRHTNLTHMRHRKHTNRMKNKTLLLSSGHISHNKSSTYK